MPDENDRRELFDVLEAGLGTRGAALLMAHLPPVGWHELATKADVAALRADLRGEMAELRGELRGEMAELRGEMGALRGGLRAEMAELRADFDRRLSGLVPKVWAANVATMIGLAGLVFAVASLAR